MTTTQQESLLRDLYRTISLGASGDTLSAFFHPEAEQIEYPSLMRPRGHRRRLDEIRAGAEVGARIIRDQHYEVHTLITQGQRAAVQFTWTATVAAELGGLPAGTPLTSHVAAFYDFRDGLVLRQSSYDCYEPLDRTAS
jgi:ketosteroid isomerase-like protein